jgi:hypothetical protein
MQGEDFEEFWPNPVNAAQNRLPVATRVENRWLYIYVLTRQALPNAAWEQQRSTRRSAEHLPVPNEA